VTEYLQQVAQNRPALGTLGSGLKWLAEQGAAAAAWLGSFLYRWVIKPLVNSLVKAFRWAIRGIQELLEKMASGAWEWMLSQCRNLMQNLEDAFNAFSREADSGSEGTVDVVLEWVGRVLEMAWRAIMFLLELVGAVLTFVLAKIIHGARFVFANLGINWDEFLGPDNLQVLKRIFGDEVEGWGGNWTTVVSGWVNNEFQAIWEKVSNYFGGSRVAGAAVAGGGLVYRVPMAAGANGMIWWVEQMLKDQNSSIPTDHVARQEALSQDTTDIRTSLHTFETSSAKLDLFFAWAELILTIAVGVVMAFTGAAKAVVRFLLSKFGSALPPWLNVKAASLVNKLDVAQVILAGLKALKSLLMDLIGTLGLGAIVFIKYLAAMFGFVKT
jgi:hypothetical protein